MFSELLARHWWLFLLRGLISILFGVLAFVWPGITLASLVLVFGAFAFADGVFALVGALRGGGREPWWLLILEGLVGIGIGIITVVSPGITALALLFYIAIWAIATGVLEIGSAIALRKEIEHEWLLGLSGLASVVFGVLLIARPGAGALTVLWLIGGYALVFGVLLVMLSFRARRLSARATPLPHPA
ncbi:MAG TPA: HdeD family acid-resistance protein [Myxococcota bacterium]|nr:HdeD family acid-resistance protein [Myxococcota bacterium]